MKLYEIYLTCGQNSEEFSTNLENFVRYCISKHYRRYNEDLMQDILLKVYRALPSFDASKGNFETYIYSLARNCITNFLWQEKKNQSLSYVIDDDIVNNKDDKEKSSKENKIQEILEVLSEIDKKTTQKKKLEKIKNKLGYTKKDIISLLKK